MKFRIGALAFTFAGVTVTAILVLLFVLPNNASTSPLAPIAGSQKNGGTASGQNPALIDSIRSAIGSPDPVLAAALAETDPARRKLLLEQWAQALKLDAYATLLEKSGTMPDRALQSEIRSALLKSWNHRDLAGSLTWFENRGGADSLYQQARDQLAQTMAEGNPVQMLAWMQSALPRSSQKELYVHFFGQWASHDPAAAANALQSLANSSPDKTEGPDPLWSDLLVQVAAQWSNIDLKQAVSWAQSLAPGMPRDKALAQISYRWAEVDPQAAAAFAAQQNNPEMLQNVAGKWANEDPRAAAVWAGTLPDGETRDTAVTLLATIWAEKDPSAAATYASSLGSDEARSRAALAVASVWADNEPNRAASWIGQFPEGDVRDQALQKLMTSWPSRNATEAAGWLQALPQTHSRDVAVSTYAGAVLSSSPEDAFRWAATIADETLRNEELQTVAQTWLAKDSTAARQGISQSRLSQNLKTELLSNIAPSY